MEPTIGLMQPSAGPAVPYRKAVNGFLRASKRFAVAEINMATTSTPRCFNLELATAMNFHERQSPLAYLAMLHDDIGPDDVTGGHGGDGWLDLMVDELERTGAFLVSALVPIRDGHGLTSTAVDMAGATGDPWLCRRITTREAFALPETFGAGDVPWNSHGGALLANTGCWVARYDPEVFAAFADPDRRGDGQSGFRFLNRLERHPVTREWVSRDIAEDWDFARQLAALDRQVLVTRKVRLEHGGPQYHNRHPWGDWPVDIAYLELDRMSRPAADGWLFPADVPGWLSLAEGECLARYASGKMVLEIGSYCGRSTVCMAQTALGVHAVDPFDGRATDKPGDTLPKFMESLARFGCVPRLSVHQGTSALVVPRLNREFDFAFIDGAHDEQSVLLDARLAVSKLGCGGLLGFHDYHDFDVGVVAAVDKLLANGYELIERVDSLAIVRPALAAFRETTMAETTTLEPPAAPTATEPRLSHTPAERKLVGLDILFWMKRGSELTPYPGKLVGPVRGKPGYWSLVFWDAVGVTHRRPFSQEAKQPEDARWTRK